MASGSRAGPAPDLRSITSRPSALFLWGDSRAVVNRVLFAMSHANDSGAYWLDIKGPRDESGEFDPLDLGWIPRNRRFVVEQPEQARPQDAPANSTLFSVIRPDEPPVALTKLDGFLRLPAVAQELISRSSGDVRPRVVAIANADRVRPYYPTRPSEVRTVLEPFLQASVHPFIGARAPPGDGRWAFEFVFEARATNASSWESGAIVCEKAPDGSAFRSGESTPLTAFPEIASTFRGRPRTG